MSLDFSTRQKMAKSKDGHDNINAKYKSKEFTYNNIHSFKCTKNRPETKETYAYIHGT